MTTRRWTYLAAGLLGCASAVALAHAIVGAEASRRIGAAIARIPGVQVGSVFVEPWSGRVVVSHLSARAGAAGITAGTVTFQSSPLMPQFVVPAHAAGGTATAENVDFDLAGTKIHIPKIEATGTNLSNEDLAKIFDPKSSEPVAERVSRFSAEEISIPEMTSSGGSPDMAMDAVVKDTKLLHVKNGKIEAYTTGPMTLSTRAPKGGGSAEPVVVSLGSSNTMNFDVGLYARVIAQSRTDDSEALAPLYDSMGADGLAVKGEGFSFTAAKFVAGKGMVRPFMTPLAGFETLAPTEPGQKPTPAQTKKILQALTDIYESLDLGAGEIKDITGSFGQGERAGALKLARLGLDFAKAGAGELAADGFELTGPMTKIKFDTFALRGFDFKGAMETLKSVSPDDPGMRRVNPRAFIPTLGEVVLKGLDATVPARRGAGNADGGGSNKFKVAKAEIKASRYFLGIPSALAASVEHLTLALPPRDPNARPLTAMGYTGVDITSKFEYAWNEAVSTLALKDFSLKGECMGTVSLSGLLGNVTRDLFAGDVAVMQAAVLGAAVKEVGLRLENDGLITRLLEAQAAQAGVTVDQLKQELIKTARGQVAQLFGASTQANGVADALSAFLQQPKSLEVTAKSTKGMSAADFPLLQNPPELIKRLDIQATANQ